MMSVVTALPVTSISLANHIDASLPFFKTANLYQSYRLTNQINTTKNKQKNPLILPPIVNLFLH